MKLMRSMPGVPSATPAQENRACTGPPHSSTAASIDALSDRSRLMALTPSSFTSARSITTTSAPASFTSSAVAAPMPVAPPTTRARLPSYLNASNKLIALLSLPRVGDAADDLLGRRVDVLERGAGVGLDELAVDEHAVLGVDRGRV